MKSLCRLVLPLSLLLLSPLAHAADFVLESLDIHEGDRISIRHAYADLGCKGGNRAPMLMWRNPPAGTRSFAVTVQDLDAPGGNGAWNWIVVNLPAGTTELKEGAAGLPPGTVQTRNDYGRAGYGGPCSLPGKTHRYEFSVWALKSDRLKIDAKANATLAAFMIKGDALGRAKITATYSR